MADTRYLKRRGGRWYFQIAVPLELRGKPPWHKQTEIIKALGTADLNLAQKMRWDLLAEHKEAFRRAAGDIPLTKGEIQREAWRVYQETLASLEAEPAWAGTPYDDESPEEAGLSIGIDQTLEALADAEFRILAGEGWSVSLVATDIAAIEKRTGVEIKPKTETWRLLGEAILNARVAAIEGRLRALRNLPSEPPATFVPGGIDRVTLKPVAIPPRPKIRSGEGSKSFSEAASEYIAEIQRDNNAKLTEQTRGQHEMAFRLFGQFVNNVALAAIGRTDATEFLAAISKLDPNWGRSPETKSLTVDEILKRFSGDKGLSNRTLNRYVASLSGLFKWSRRRGYFDGTNPFSEQSRPKARKGSTGWLPYKIDELNALFHAPLFNIDQAQRIRPDEHSTDTAMLWVPLIALFSGMRLGEICQLRKDDVQRERKIWFFNVNEETEGQSVKTMAGIRRVPVHSILIKCGLLQYRDELQERQLFPGLSPGGPDDKRSWYFTRRYTEFRRGVKINRPRVSFHSFRKNVSTSLDNARVSRSDIAALIGHERGFTLDTYSAGLELRALQDIAEKIRYRGLNLSHLYTSEIKARTAKL